VADIAVATLDISAAGIVNALSERLSGLSGEESGGIWG
jgi:hypothetical protein